MCAVRYKNNAAFGRRFGLQKNSERKTAGVVMRRRRLPRCFSFRITASVRRTNAVIPNIFRSSMVVLSPAVRAYFLASDTINHSDHVQNVYYAVVVEIELPKIFACRVIHNGFDSRNSVQNIQGAVVIKVARKLGLV